MFFLKFSCFLYNPANVGNLISGSSAFSKPSLNIWKFFVHIMLKSSMQDFKHILTSMGDDASVQWLEYSRLLPFLGIGMKIDLFQSCSYCKVFQICWHIECSNVLALSFRVFNSSSEVPSHPLTLLTSVLPNTHLTSRSRMSGTV